LTSPLRSFAGADASLPATGMETASYLPGHARP
jgi:hypothetical protein